MHRSLKSYTKLALEPFNRAHALFVSSSGLVMLFPMISAPIIARLYSPEDFGIYAVFFSLATILSSVSSLELRNIALLEEARSDGIHGTVLALTAVVIFSLLISLLIFMLPDSILIFLVGSNVHAYLIWLPLTIFLMGGSQVIYTWATREKEYKILARNKLILGISTMLLQIGIGFMGYGAIGFIIANILGLLLASLLLLVIFLKAFCATSIQYSAYSAFAQFKRYYRLTLWTMPATLVNSLSQFLPELLINRFFGAAQLGQYSFAVRMLNMPIAFLSSSIQDFFRQQAAFEFNKNGHCTFSFLRFLILTLVGAIFLIVPVIFLVPYVFPIIFGEQWTDAGSFIQAVAFLTIIRFVSSPLSYIWIIQGQQSLDFLWQLGLLSLTLGTLILPPMIEPQITLYETLWIYSVLVGIWYLIAITISYHLSKNPNKIK